MWMAESPPDLHEGGTKRCHQGIGGSSDSGCSSTFAESRRCVIVLSGFYEFVGSKYPKAKYRFALKGSPVMGIAGLWSEGKNDGKLSFTMLTTAPGPDIQPYHDRQVCVLAPDEWAAWLFLTRPQEELLRPLPKGTLGVTLVRNGSD